MCSVGMLVLPAYGTSVSGPYTIPELVRLGFQGLYPSNALPLKDGSVVSLFLGTRKLPDGAWADDLGLERMDPSSEGEPNAVLITRFPPARGDRGIPLRRYPLAYDPHIHRRFAVCH